MLIYLIIVLMKTILTYRGKQITADDVAYIKQMLTDNPDLSRNALSIKLCRAWNWVQPNGALRDMVARGMMLELHRGGHIQLPEKKRVVNNPFVNRKGPEVIEVDQNPLDTTINTVRPLCLKQVRRSPYEKLFNSLMDQFHYLGYTQPVGEHLKYLVFHQDKPVACLAWSSAPRHIGARDRFIGWDADTRIKNLHTIAYNTRFLILPWIRIPHLASHILGLSARTLASDWQTYYQHPIYYLETFIDTQRFKGTCYKAANWIYVGTTKGLGKDAKSKVPNRSIKAVYGYPLAKRFRELMSGKSEKNGAVS